MANGTSGLPLHTRLLQKLNRDVATDWPSHGIFKVPNLLRRISEQAYEPQVISIGPYHHGKAQLKKMEKYKMFNLKKLLERRTESSLESYVTALEGMEEKAREFYSEPLNHIGGEKFVEMMLLDGCFITELIRNSAIGEIDPPLAPFFYSRAMLDLLLVENQLPFFILWKLFSMTVMPDDEPRDFVDMAIEVFRRIMPGSLRRPENQNFKHLLGLLHDSCVQAPSSGRHAPSSDCQEVCISCLPEKVKRSLCSKAKPGAVAIPCLSSPSKSAEEDQEIEMEPSASMPSRKLDMRSQCPKTKRNFCSSEVLWSLPLKIIEKLVSKCASDPSIKEGRFIRSATELSEAGINFRKFEVRSLFHIEFQKGVMSIPTLRIDDYTESLLRNLVAYEQCFEDASSNCFTNYITFMDRLINTWKDVELLSHHEIIDNWLGDHKVVAAIFNKLGDNVVISEDFFHAYTFKEVNKHCDRKWNQWKAKLWHNYFNTPWAGISFLAAVFLLLLTVLQSVFSVLSYLFK